MAGSRYENDILWLYSNGIVSGVNDNSNLRPKSNATRAECCTMVVTLLHPERWKQIDWDAVTAGTESSGSQTSSGTDFKGKTRIRYSNDVAYDFRRALEEQIGIQIFYLPEWTPKEAGVLQYEGIRQLGIDQEYFTRVLAELRGHSQRLEHYLLHPGELQQQLFQLCVLLRQNQPARGPGRYLGLPLAPDQSGHRRLLRSGLEGQGAVSEQHSGQELQLL